MHIPDNFLSPSTCAVLGASMIPIWKRASTKVKKELSKKKLPMIGVCAAFSFLIMMFNIPLPGGTTGHAVGAVLASILLGPYAASISITIVLLIQALFFGDGGVLAFGANSFNMAFVMTFSGYYTYLLIKSSIKNRLGEYGAVFVGAYTGVVLGSFAAAVEFGIQPILFKDVSGFPLYCPYSLEISIPAMVIPHLLIIGVLEGIVTIGVYLYIKKVSPSVVYHGELNKLKPLFKLLAAFIILSPLGLLASGTAWGEWGGEELQKSLGFLPKGIETGFSFKTLFSSYDTLAGAQMLSYITSAIIGVAVIFIIINIVIKMSRN